MMARPHHVALPDHGADACERRRIAPQFSQHPVRAQDVVNRPGRLDAAAGQDHEVVAHALELGDDVRREHGGQSTVGDGLHQRLEELRAGERVERGELLVEQQQHGPLRQRERQRGAAGALLHGLHDRSAGTQP